MAGDGTGFTYRLSLEEGPSGKAAASRPGLGPVDAFIKGQIESILTFVRLTDGKGNVLPVRGFVFLNDPGREYALFEGDAEE